jgi:DNA-binding CsgD family transcriptional regulator/tetratricopeptide (TPR) repeat protein
VVDNRQMLLDRHSSLAALAEHARDAGRGEGRLVLVSGEAGVGKSALVEQFERDLPGARWCWGACDGLFTPRPLGPLFDLAEQLGGELLELSRAGASRDRLFGAVLRELDAFTVVVVEDMHWSDEATIDLVRYLARRVRDTHGLLVATYRDDCLPVHHPFRIALGEMAAMPSTRRVELEPLSAAAVATLAEKTGIDPTLLYHLTNGNPFYVTEIIRSGLRTLPASARDAVLARIAGLRDTARRTLEIAALTGARVEVDVLTAAVGGDAVDEIVSTGLLRGSPLSFRHEIARLAVAESVAPHRRPGIHARVLTALRATGCADDARLAYHADEAGDNNVLAYAQRAAQTAAGLASHREAVAQFERALRFASGRDPETLTQLYVDYSVELSHLDRVEEATAAVEQALVLCRRAGDSRREGDLLWQLSRTMGGQCRGDDAVAAVQASVSILEPFGPSVELAWAYATAAWQQSLVRDLDGTVSLARRAQEIAAHVGAADVLSDALNTEACTIARTSDHWPVPMGRALTIALAADHQEQAARAFANFCGMYMDDWRFAEAQRYFADGIAYCDEHELTCYATFIRGEQATMLERTGHWAEATTISRAMLSAAGTSPVHRLFSLRRLGTVLARQGAPGVWTHLDEAATTADASGELQQIVPVRLARTEAYWLQGRVEAARSEVESIVDLSARCWPWEAGAMAAWLRRTASAGVVTGPLAAPYQRQLAGDSLGAARLWLDLGCRYDAALALYDGQTEAGLRKALDIFVELGAAPAARLTRRRMRQLGIKSVPAGAHPATRTHPLGLTPRQDEVLELLCAGNSDAEIAATLFISTRTAGHHVSAVLAKLGVPTRSAAAAAAGRLGLVTANR